MVWRNKHRAGRRKREHIAALRKQPIITEIESGKFISDHAKRQLLRAAWREQHANLCDRNDIEIIDLTQESEEDIDSEQAVPTQTIYTATITRLFTQIEQHLSTVGYLKRKE